VKKANGVIPSPPLSAPKFPGRGALALKQRGAHAPQSCRRARNPCAGVFRGGADLMGISAQVAIIGAVSHTIAKLTHADRRFAGPL
jgi:hypothetical protein